MNQVFEKAKEIKCVICDIDGVMTDGLIYIDNHNNEIKSFNIQDGLGLVMLMKVGIQVAVITGSTNAVIDHRMRQLGITHYFTGQKNKQVAYESIKKTLELSDEQFAYIGDDLPDLPIMRQVGLSIAVANAVQEVKKHATWNTEFHGGRGAVREACDLILNAQNKLTLAIEKYLNP